MRIRSEKALSHQGTRLGMTGKTGTEYGRWMMEAVLPQWVTLARHPDGGFVSLVPIQGPPDAGQPRDLLVQGRLAYCFAQAHALGAPGTWAIDAAVEAFDVILGPLRSSDGGFRKRTLSSAPGPDDAVRDFYDHTFVIFSAAWLYRLTSETRYRDVMHEVIDLFDARMAHPAGGYREAVDHVAGPRRQNPHMHLLEALLAAYEATADAMWLERARGIVDLFLSHFHDRETDTVIEFMTENLVPMPGAQGQWREPGHQFEWTWLLLDYHEKSGDMRVIKPANDIYAAAIALGLHRFADDQRGVVEGTNGREVLSLKRLLWPQTEYIKAEAKRAALSNDASGLDAAAAALAMTKRVFFSRDDETWRNVVLPDGSSTETTVPTRVLYHLVFAIAEYERAVAKLQPSLD